MLSRQHLIILSILVAAVVILVLALGIGLGVGLKKKSDDLPPSAYLKRIDCYPELRWGDEKNFTQFSCESRGCCYSVTSYDKVPVCYVCVEGSLGAGYDVMDESIHNGDTLSKNVKINLQSRNINDSQGVKKTLQPSRHATFELELGDDNFLHFKLYPSDTGDLPRYEVPREAVNVSFPTGDNFAAASRGYKVVVTKTSPFSFQVIRVSSGAVLFDIGVGGLVLSDQFLSISTILPSSNIYGIGENTHTTFKHDLNFPTWPLFGRDEPVGGVKNHYGVHPFYTSLETDGNMHGVLLLNSNAMDYSLTPLPMLTYRTIGGILDFYMMLGPTPENVIQQYTSLVGRPYMPPYWALGFQLCRYGYNSLDNLIAAVNRTKSAGIPQDVQYADIDHYDERAVFTVDNQSFAGLSEYFQSLRADGMRIIIILDPCLITNVTGYEPFKLGLERDIYVRWPSKEEMPPADFSVTNSTAMLGFVWPKGKVVFPDFLRSNTSEAWQKMIVDHHGRLPFNGLWIDMNEPANFGTNTERSFNWPEDDLPYWSLKCPSSQWDQPPYRTMATYVYDAEARLAGRPEGARLSDKTLCMIARHGDQSEYRHYDVHNLYGTTQLLPTLLGLRQAIPNERGIVIGRSTFVGSGKHGGHWLGDNTSNWPQLRESIIGMLEFNLFGIPYIGADICGFFDNTTDELCTRWMQLGAFYPFARNHNALGLKDQDPGTLSEVGQRLSREAMLLRYSLLPYLYTLFHIVHVKGGTVVRPLHHEFPLDDNTWAIDQQFLWGSSLMIIPIVEEGKRSLTYYLPVSAIWYDYYTNTTTDDDSDGWRSMSIEQSSSIPLFVRAGSILPTQDPANNTDYSRQNVFRLRIYLNDESQLEEKATGELFWDDGVSIDTYENERYYYAIFSCTQNYFSLVVTFNSLSPEVQALLVLDSISIAGVASRPTHIFVNSTELEHGSFSYGNKKIEQLGLDTVVKLTANVAKRHHKVLIRHTDSEPLGM